mmetsp:Transcript_73861/g.175821  ORF Transcript_73861/g.175821 Transcript_73861/m.175821 type:complete len:447 (-) Transcript_73861:120-1460(-)
MAPSPCQNIDTESTSPNASEPFATVEDVSLACFLSFCKQGWGPKDIQAVRRKLAIIGVFDVRELLSRLHAGSLNRHLDGHGERKFTAETLILMKDASASLFGGKSLTPHSGSSTDAHTPRGSGTGSARRPSLGSLHAAGARMAESPVSRNGPGGADLDLRDLSRMRQEMWQTDDLEHSLFLSRQISKGMDRMERVATKARQQNNEAMQDLLDVQADLERLTKKVKASRESRQPRSFAPSHASGPTDGSAVAAGLMGMMHEATTAQRSFRSAASEIPRRAASKAASAGPSPAASSSLGSTARPPRESERQPDGRDARPRASSSSRVRRGPPLQPTQEPACARATQSHFSFGGCGGGGRSASQPRPGAGPKPSATQAAQKKAPDVGNAVMEAVRNEMVAARSFSKADQRAMLKRLMVRWHPDRNPDSVETATAVFQFIQQEKGNLLEV